MGLAVPPRWFFHPTLPSVKEAINRFERAVAALPPDSNEAKIYQALTDVLRRADQRLETLKAEVETVKKRLTSG